MGFKMQIVQINSITEFTGQITSINDDNVRSIIRIATNSGTMWNSQDTAGPRQRNSVFEGVLSPGYIPVLRYTEQNVGRVGQ